MIISIVGTKGSQGKSTLAHSIAFSKGFGIITNDIDSSIDEFLPEEQVLKFRNDDEFPDIPNDMGVVFDGKAGIDEAIVKQAIQKSDWVIVPTIYGVEELKRCIRGIRQVEKINPKIIVVCNMMRPAEFEEVKQLIHAECNYPMFHIRNSKFVAELLFIPESIEAKKAKGGLIGYGVKDINEQFNALFKFMGI